MPYETKAFTRSAKVKNVSETHKSAITDHVATENHVMDWDAAKVVAHESDRTARWIRRQSGFGR